MTERNYQPTKIFEFWREMRRISHSLGKICTNQAIYRAIKKLNLQPLGFLLQLAIINKHLNKFIDLKSILVSNTGVRALYHSC